MKNPDFKASARTVWAAVIISAVLLTLVCVLPCVLIGRLYDEVSPLIDSARTAVSEEDYSSAEAYCKRITAAVEKDMRLLQLFYDHRDIYALYNAAASAEAIAPTEDPAQLLEELCSARTAIEMLRSRDRASIFNLL